MAEVNDNGSIQLFEDQKIRTAWDAEKEEWYFSIIDVISVLTGTANPRRYWSDLKRKLKVEEDDTNITHEFDLNPFDIQIGSGDTI